VGRPVSWLALLVLAAGAYGCKTVGVLAMGGREPSPRASALLALLPVPLLAALVAVQTFSSARALVLDARAAALAVAGVAVWWHAPFLVVVLVGAGTAAGLRALG
jgi:uncharacterized membrane protein